MSHKKIQKNKLELIVDEWSFALIEKNKQKNNITLLFLIYKNSNSEYHIFTLIATEYIKYDI